MQNYPLHVREDLLNYVPPYILEEISCFALGDGHLMSRKSVDITICTFSQPGNASVKELNQREIVGSMSLNCKSKPTQIISSRNRNCELFYVVSAGAELFILNGEELSILKKINNVVLFDISDNLCSGEGTLRVMSTDHVNPLEFDDSFNIVEENLNSVAQTETSPAMVNLQQKLSAARYTLDHNKKLLEKYKELRHRAGFKMIQRMHPGLSELVFKQGCQEMAADLRINIQLQWTKSFNDKLIIGLELSSDNDMPLEELNILLQDHDIPTMVYETKIFEGTSTPPYWKELKTKCSLKKNTAAAVVTVINLEDLENIVFNKIELSGVLFYKIEGKEKYLPLEKVKVAAMDIRGESLSLLGDSKLGKEEILAILAASTKTDLIFQHIKRSDKILNLVGLLNKIGLERVTIGNNVLVYKKSPYDRLHGVMVVVPEKEVEKGPINVAVYSRNESQVLFLINLLHETTDERIVITTPNHRVEAKTSELAEYNYLPKKTIDSEKLLKSLLKQVTATKEHLEDCMAKMRQSDDEVTSDDIDIFACGLNHFEDFKKKIVNEMNVSVELMSENVKRVEEKEEKL